MYNSSSDNDHIYQAKARKEVISLIVQRVDSPYNRPIHCINCGRVFSSITNGYIAIISDSPGVEYDVNIEIHCPKCQTRYRMFV